MALWQPWRTFFARKQDFICPKVREWPTKLYNFCKTYSTQRVLLDTKNAVLTTQLINSRQNPEEVLLNVRKWSGGKSQRIHLLKMILLPVGMQFWQPSHTTFEKKWKLSLTVGTRKCKVFIGKCFCSPCSYVHLEISFDNPVEKFVKNDDGFLPKIWKLYKTSKCCYGNLEGSFDNPMKKFSTEGRKFFDRNPNKKNY